MNTPLPSVTNARVSNYYNYRVPHPVSNNRNHDNVIFENPDIYQIGLNQYPNGMMPNEHTVNFQKATKDDLPSYEDLFLSSQKKGENSQDP